MSIFDYFMFCLQEQQWSAPAVDNHLPDGLLSDEL